MEYMLIINATERGPIDPSAPEFGDWMATWVAYNQKLIDGGHFVSGGQLAPAATATTLRRDDQGDTLLDGPFAETKEQLGGWYVVRAADLDEAIALARAMPIAPASIEIRPIATRPDAAAPA